MTYYFAPMEGLTDSIFRRVHHKYFPGIDCYYMPFLSPTMHRTLTHREERELPLADSVPFTAVPQVLTKSAQDFLWAAEVIRDRGYGEVNLNVGCPSGTVVSKGKGSGMLRDRDALDAFLYEIFQNAPLPISVKTRLGLETCEEFPALLEIYNRYPIRELIIHPRIRKQFYTGGVDAQMLAWALENSKNPVCCNGDILTKSQADACPTPSVMIGRGLIADPGMLSGGTNPAALAAYLEELLATYEQEFGGSRNAMFRMKEHWGFLHSRFEGSEKLWKKLRKTTDAAEFKLLSNQIIHTLPYK